MASPQKENGYTAIANELLEAFSRLNLSPYCWRVLLCILRHSYGWQKKAATLTYSQIAQFTGIDVRLLPRTIKSLQKKNIIVRDGHSFRLQKDYIRWLPSQDDISRDDISRDDISRDDISRDVKSSSPEMIGTPKKCNKINNLSGAKENKEIYIKKSLRERLIKRFNFYYPTITVPHNIPFDKLDFFLYLIEENKVNPSEIEFPIRYIQSRKLTIEPFPPLHVRDAEKERIKQARLLRIKREREEQARFKEEHSDELKQLISEFRGQLEAHNAVSPGYWPG